VYLLLTFYAQTHISTRDACDTSLHRRPRPTHFRSEKKSDTCASRPRCISRRRANHAIIVISTLSSITPSATIVRLPLLVVPFAITHLHHRKGYTRCILHNIQYYSVVVDYTLHRTCVNVYKHTYTPTN